LSTGYSGREGSNAEDFSVMTDATAADLGLGDLVLVALYSPLERNYFALNDGIDEVLAGADLLEDAVRGGFRDDRRAALRWIRANCNGRRDAGVARLTSLGLASCDEPEFVVKVPGSRPRGVARMPPLVFARPELGESLRRQILTALREPTADDGPMLCLAMVIDAGPWIGSRVAPGPENRDARDALQRMRKSQALPAALTAYLARLGVDPTAVLAVVDATRRAVKDSRAAW
jgi:hypothetical protein